MCVGNCTWHELLRDVLNRLTQENRELKQWSVKKWLYSLCEKMTVRCDILLDWRIIWHWPHFSTLCQHAYLRTGQKRILSSFQALMLTLMHIKLNTRVFWSRPQHPADIFTVSRTTASKVFHVLFYRLKYIIVWYESRTRSFGRIPSYPLYTFPMQD